MRLRSGFDSEATIVKERFFLRRIGGTDLIDSETLSIGKIIPRMVVQAPHRKTKLDQDNPLPIVVPQTSRGFRNLAPSATFITRSNSTQGERGGIHLVAGKFDRSKCRKNFLQYWRAADRLSARRFYREIMRESVNT